jgi:hypothetical protein
MPKKEKTIQIETQDENGDTHTVEFTNLEWSLINAYFSEGMNQTRAYLSVHPSTKYDSAKVEASKFFTRPNIKAEVARRLKEKTMSVDEVLARLGDMARASHQPFIKVADDGFIYFDFSHPDAKSNLHLIKKIKTKRERRLEGKGEDAQEWEGEWVEVELHDASAALRDLGRYYAIFTDKQVIEGEIKITRKKIGVDMDKI